MSNSVNSTRSRRGLRPFRPSDPAVRHRLRRFDLASAVRPFSRCMRCNEPLQPVAKADVLHRVPPMVRVERQSFSRCPRCARLYWRGSHWQRMRRRLDTLLATAHRLG